MAEFPAVMNTPQQFESLVLERAAWINSTKDHRQRTTLQMARKMSNIDKSDPFTFDRVMSHLENNMATPDDFRKRK